ncbi:MAG: methenyltetrahydromethanopterin cyclohydrolase [Gammaproteobacteria bacterium]|nr:methenyltetrahydromethanopterin cyclohydrolase [Gammaproteobacteria bacterium]
MDKLSISAGAMPLLRSLREEQESLRLAVHSPPGGAAIIDAGIEVPGSLEAGRRIAEICLGGLARVDIRAGAGLRHWPWEVDVRSASPVVACLGSQYAGWKLSHGSGKDGFFALGSGPARALGSKEPLFQELGYRDRASESVLVLETDRLPPEELVLEIAEACSLRPESLSLILTPTTCLSGAVQIVARVLETALHKAHELRFPLSGIVDGMGSAPLCPPAPEQLVAMGRSNDAILFAGRVHLFVAAGDEEAQELAERLPSSASRDYGKPFAQVFREAEFDFYRIDPMLFAPAWVAVTSLVTGRTFHSGRRDEELLDRSFGSPGGV